jgi:NTP pyrophosphatase (non-canonical NTP hydrolase)
VNNAATSQVLLPSGTTLDERTNYFLTSAFIYAADINRAAEAIHSLNEKWWVDLRTGQRLERNKGEMIALMHSELSEMLEGVRKNTMDSHIPHRPSETVELADLIIRALDYAGAHRLDLLGAIKDKLAYNVQRADHKTEARLADGGKKF